MTKNERHKPAAQDVHHCASQLWVKDEEEERVDEGMHEGHVDRHLMEVVIKKLAAIRCVLEILRKPKINMHEYHVACHLMKVIKAAKSYFLQILRKFQNPNKT